MRHRVLMVIPNEDARDFIIDEVEAFGRENGVAIEIDKEETLNDAIIKCRDAEQYSLIIAHAHLRPRRKSALVEKDMLGLCLFTELSKNGFTVPGILLTPYVDAHLESQCTQLPFTALIVEGGQWIEQIEARLIQVFQRKATCRAQTDAKCPRTPKKSIKVDLYIQPNKDTWMVVFDGEGGLNINPTPRPLRVNLSKINQIKDNEKKIYRNRNVHPDWEDTLKNTGEILMREILQNNQDILNYYNWLRGQVGGCENFRVRFSTGIDDYALLLEAILVPDAEADDDFWMLKAPICRRVEVGDTALLPLFEGPEKDASVQKLNCLIIEADTSGPVEGMELYLKPLKNISMETDHLEKKLKTLQEEDLVGRIKRLPDKNNACTRENLKDLLTNGDEWHLVHYAGHSYHDDGNTGYIFLPKGDQPDKVDIKCFSKWLRTAKTRLIYMSSCQSSETRFIHNLAKDVPSAVGFRWSIDDDKAAAHARIFYDNLFNERSLEYAFLKTRQRVWEDNPENIIWAAPILMMQLRK